MPTPLELAQARARSELRSARSAIATVAVARAPAERQQRDRMNKTERAYADVLDLQMLAGEVAEWHFDQITFELGSDCRFRPDFFVVLISGEAEIREVKGRRKDRDAPLVEDDALVKLKLMPRVYPFRVRVVWPAGALGDGAWRTQEILP